MQYWLTDGKRILFLQQTTLQVLIRMETFLLLVLFIPKWKTNLIRNELRNSRISKQMLLKLWVMEIGTIVSPMGMTFLVWPPIIMILNKLVEINICIKGYYGTWYYYNNNYNKLSPDFCHSSLVFSCFFFIDFSRRTSSQWSHIILPLPFTYITYDFFPHLSHIVNFHVPV